MKSDTFTIMIVDSDPKWSKSLKYMIDHNGFEVQTAVELSKATAMVRKSGAAFVLLNVRRPEEVDTEELRAILGASAKTHCIALLNEETESYEKVLRQSGVQDFLASAMPVHQLAQVLERFRQCRRLEEENERLRQLLECRTSFESLLGGSAPMRALYRLIEQVSRTDTPALISGEPGSEFIDVARSLHERGERAVQPMVIFDCQQVDPEDHETTLFGPVRNGSYPRGPSPEKSVFAKAGKGSVVVLNIDKLRRGAQDRLLEFMRSPFFQGETSSTPQPIARLVVATSVDLEKQIDQNQFNRELYYRLSVLKIQVPPLRDRCEDIPLLAEHFLHELAGAEGSRKGRVSRSFSSDALLRLFQHSWPGNVEELSRSVREAAGRAKDMSIELEHLPAAVTQTPHAEEKARAFTSVGAPLREAKRDFETEYFRNLLKRTKGNMTMASRISKVGRPYLYKKLKECGIEPNEFR